jgi:hypothetical protein
LHGWTVCRRLWSRERRAEPGAGHRELAAQSV